MITLINAHSSHMSRHPLLSYWRTHPHLHKLKSGGKNSCTETIGKLQLQSHTDKRSFIVYLWTVCTFIISDKDDSSSVIKPLSVLSRKQMRMNK